jgi:hypothetical protein
MNKLVPAEIIEKRIIYLRGQKVMLDRDPVSPMLLPNKVSRCFPQFSKAKGQLKKNIGFLRD